MPDDPTDRTPDVGDIATDLIGQVRARAAADLDRKRSRGPVATALLILTAFGVLSCVFALGYGLYYFADGPIRPAGDGYVGKTGTRHTAAEYQDYGEWSMAMWTVFPATFVAAGLYAFAERRDRWTSRDAH
jgi:hypothetical protein